MPPQRMPPLPRRNTGAPSEAYGHNPKVPGPYLDSPQDVSSLLLVFPHLDPKDDALAERVCIRVRKYMKRYDNTHDYEHIQRVVANADRIWNSDPMFAIELNPLVVFLGCLMHDVGDHKYLRFWESGERIKEKMLIKCGASKQLARKVQIIATNVSYRNEKRRPGHVRRICNEHKELAVVLDADRLEALGPVGLARTFAFHGRSRQFRHTSIWGALQHNWEKLYELPSMMKTAYGRDEGQRLWKKTLEFTNEFSLQADISAVVNP
ncbi:hypothetical protein BU24DRAFT_462611 [Aaosphaeria arxii CBS 175.79]|uniref:HD/PDEase domain-containing protein n=1 Tax=Aaosphaeria arxii CBS 175.79 TaxID=1450172 RepID=A0A6A5XT44_9PLEO|nr:uncharacterized protein BU24DRAFT_462611 [Aaosphaeria arxii CBS 175.79]KAF2016458.1 hypothetical protein BU24DRAFT_462611 [Aaosphaeria arxii CBS 175.79]